MAMDMEEVKRKAEKLMAFTEGRATPEEVEIANKKLKKLLTDYQLSIADIKNGKTNESTKEKAFTEEMANIPAWLDSLIGHIARAYDCQVIIMNTFREVDTSFGRVRKKVVYPQVIGKASDIEIAEYMVGWLKEALPKYADEDAKAVGIKGGEKLRFKNGYIMGAAAAIEKRIADERAAAAASNERSLMVIKDNEVGDYIKEKYPNLRERQGTSAGADGMGRMLGAAKGSKMGLTKGVKGGGDHTQIGR